MNAPALILPDARPLLGASTHRVVMHRDPVTEIPRATVFGWPWYRHVGRSVYIRPAGQPLQHASAWLRCREQRQLSHIASWRLLSRLALGAHRHSCAGYVERLSRLAEEESR